MATYAALAASVIGGAVAGCSKSGGGGSQPSSNTTTAAASAPSSVATSSSASTPPPSGKTVEAYDGSFTVVVPDSLNVHPKVTDGHTILEAIGNGGKAILSTELTSPDERGATCKDTIEKVGPAAADAWGGTFDPSSIQSVTVDGESGSRGNPELKDIGTGERVGAILCVRHHDAEYLFTYFGMADPGKQDVEAIIGSWKWK
jgi:hypothetical protein